MALVYWLRLPEHTDIFTQGYVGVTTQTVSKRVSQHFSKSKKSDNIPLYNALRKYKDDIVFDTILIGDVDYVYGVELKLRPFERIGWNCAQGGDNSSIGRVRKKRTKEHCESLSKSLTGRTFSESHKSAISKAKKEVWSVRERIVGQGANNNPDIWSIADKIYEDRINGLSGSKICENRNIKNVSNIHSMIYVHFKKGWVPTDDPNWVTKYKGTPNE